MRRSTNTMISLFLKGALTLTVIGLVTACGPKYPNCDNDDSCHSGEFCVNNQCQQCRPDGNDCASGQQCVDGRCDAIAGWCNSDATCPSGQQCQGNQCVSIQTVAPTQVQTPNAQCQLSSVNFSYDSAELEATTRDGIQSNANCIRTRPVERVHLTGYCDPRGTEEYNLALGDRRARAVQRYLNSLGNNAPVTVSSMGEEMASGTDESGWSRDRRVEFTAR